MPKAKKIAVITQAVKLADEVAGLNRTSYIAELLAAEGHEVDLITSTFQHWEKRRRDIVDERYHSLPYNVIFIEEPGYKRNISLSRIRSQNTFSKNMMEYLRRFGTDYDLIWCQIPPNNIAADASAFAKEQNVPFVIDINDLWPEAMKMILDVPVLADLLLSNFVREAEVAYANATVVVGTSDEYANRCMQNIPHLTVYVGGDISRFDDGVEQHRDAIEKTADEFWITYAGSLAKSYDIPTLISACALAEPLVFETTNRRLSLRILGDGPYRKQFEDIADHTMLDTQFLGYLDYQLMAAHLAKSDILVNSLIKGAPQSIVSKIADYLSAGKPIVNTGESGEFMNMCVSHGFGINVEPGNAVDLAGALLMLAQDDGLRTQMGQNGRKVAEDQFDRPHSYRTIVDMVDNLL